MSGRQAKTLTDRQIESLLVYASATRNPGRNRLIVLLSMKAGLRAGEIANLTWDMVVGPTGHVESVLELHDHAAKNRRGRRIPLHPDLKAGLMLAAARSERP
jgi:integrase